MRYVNEHNVDHLAEPGQAATDIGNATYIGICNGKHLFELHAMWGLDPLGVYTPDPESSDLIDIRSGHRLTIL